MHRLLHRNGLSNETDPVHRLHACAMIDVTFTGYPFRFPADISVWGLMFTRSISRHLKFISTFALILRIITVIPILVVFTVFIIVLIIVLIFVFIFVL